MEDAPTSPNDTVSPLGASVRRVHTISSSSRAVRAAHRAPISEETQEYYDEDDRAEEPWNAGPGAIGDGKGALLHRQASLPTKYHRGLKSNRTSASGTLSPSGRNVNSLSVIAADHAGEGEEEWEHDMRGLRNDEHANGDGAFSPLSASGQYFQPSHSRSQSQTSNGGLSPGPYAPRQSNSPPPASSGVRRHQSLTATAAAGAAGRRRLAQRAAERAAQSPSPPSPAYADNDHGHSPISPIGRTPWGPATPPIGSVANKDWRADVEDVQRQLGEMGLAPPGQNLEVSAPNTPRRLSPGPNHPPRFRANSPQPATQQNSQQIYGPQPFNGAGGRQMAKLQLITDLDPPAVPPKQPQSAAAYVPPIGHGIPQTRRWNGIAGEQGGYRDNGNAQRQDDKPFTASGVVWDQKDRIIGTRGGFDASGAPPVPPLPQMMMQPGMNMNMGMGMGMGMNFGGMGGGLDSTSFARLGMNMGMMSPGGMNMNPTRLQVNTAVGPASTNAGAGAGATGNGGGTSPSGYLSPVDVPSLIVAKGYNPATFDIRPQSARYFVIKSYTEDDVHKSLKYEIWSSTDPGNKRLDKAFKECGGRGPIYLFFSVNASGHFCGMAEMLTPVDYTRSSTVWAQDKWKGVFKVRWIFVRDIPNASLRHIRLNNTQERKPVTNSRDTQELLPEAGHEMLRIFFTHPARTSLLQDFAFYELQSMQKISAAPSPQTVQHPYAMPNPATLPPGQQQQLALQQQLQMLQFQQQQQQQQQMQARSPGPPSPYPGGLGPSNSGNF